MNNSKVFIGDGHYTSISHAASSVLLEEGNYSMELSHGDEPWSLARKFAIECGAELIRRGELPHPKYAANPEFLAAKKQKQTDAANAAWSN